MTRERNDSEALLCFAEVPLHESAAAAAVVEAESTLVDAMVVELVND